MTIRLPAKCQTASGGALLLILFLGAGLLFPACGGDSSPTTSAPPPPNPLSWTNVPESDTILVNERKEYQLTLSAAIPSGDYWVESSDDSEEIVGILGGSTAPGQYLLILTGNSPGSATISVNAMAAGFQTAEASFPVTVELAVLQWASYPDKIEIVEDETATVDLLLNAPIDAEITVEQTPIPPDPDLVTVDGSCSAGACALTIRRNGTGRYGRTELTVTATAEGYTEAVAQIDVAVLERLEWIDVPAEIELEVGVTTTYEFGLNWGIDDADLMVEHDEDLVAVHRGRCTAGDCELVLEGREEGESSITITAAEEGFVDATVEIDVVIGKPFSLALWRELVFDAYTCPRADSSAFCEGKWGSRAVEDRITSVLPSQPNFHILTTARFTFGTYRLSRSEVETIGDAIRDAVPQTTGERFGGRITTSSTALRDQDGWVDIIPVGNEFFGVMDSGPCGAAFVGARNGTIFINVERLDDCDLLPLAMHEVGHALGFFHVLDLGDYIMSPFLTDIPPVFHDDEQSLARLAWDLGRGARYTPDPRQRSRSFTALTTDSLFPDGPKNLDAIAHFLAQGRGNLLQCHSN